MCDLCDKIFDIFQIFTTVSDNFLGINNDSWGFLRMMMNERFFEKNQLKKLYRNSIYISNP